MKSSILLLMGFFLLPTQDVWAQSARAQLVHVASDPGLSAVDVYLDGVLFADSLIYQSATPYFDIAAGQHSIAFAVNPSQSSDDAFYQTDVEIEDGETYSMVATGFGDPTAFAPNPDGLDTEFELWVDGGARVTAGANQLYIKQMYVIPDMPRSDFGIEGTSFVDAAIQYGHVYEGNAGPGPWTASLRSSGMATASYARNSFDSSDLDGLGILVFFTGRYFTGSGIDIDLLFVLPDGTTRLYPSSTKTFRAQLVHVSPDPAIASVDVYLDGGLLFQGLKYVEARPFIDLPTATHQFEVVPAGAGLGNEPLLSHREHSALGDSKHFLLTGFSEPEKWGSNPDGLDTQLKFLVAEQAHETSGRPDRFDLRQIYAIPDMPRSDFMVATFVDPGLEYGDVRDFESVDGGTWTSYMRSSKRGTDPYARISYYTDDLVGRGLLVVLCGRYFTGEGIDVEMLFVSPDGSTRRNAVDSKATYRAQMVHASPDPAVESVDVYLDGGLLFRNLSYASARPFIDVPIGTHEFEVLAAGADPKTEALTTLRKSSAGGDLKHFVLAGVVDPAQWPSNPDDHDTSIGLFTVNDALEASLDPSSFTIRHFYSVLDMPAVDFWMDTWDSKIFEDVEYGEFTEPASSNSTEDLTESVRTSGSGRHAPALISIRKNWSDYIGMSCLEVVTGVSAEIEWFYVTPDGSFESHAVVTAFEEDVTETPSEFALRGNYPNPFNPSTTITYDLPKLASVRLTVFDALGRTVEIFGTRYQVPGTYSVQFDASNLPSGIYLYRLEAGDYTETKSMILAK